MKPNLIESPHPGNKRRSDVLDTIRGAVCRDRQNSYGDAEDNFQNIADYWNLWLKQRGYPTTLTPTDVAMMSAQLKMARAAVNPTYMDNWVDLGGYAVCGAGIVQAKNVPDYAATMSESTGPGLQTTLDNIVQVAAHPASYADAMNEACRHADTTTP